MKATEFDRKFDAGEDVSGHVDWSKGKRPNEQIKRVNVDFPTWVVAGLDRQARHLGVTRQALIKLWIAERLPKSPTEGTRLSGWRQVAIALLQATEWIPPGSAGFRI